jgi:hypothetical protein
LIRLPAIQENGFRVATRCVGVAAETFRNCVIARRLMGITTLNPPSTRDRTAMTQDYPPPPAYAPTSYAPETFIDPTVDPPGDPSGAGAAEGAKNQASQLGNSATDATQHVAGVAKEQVSVVTAETGRQAKDVLQQAQTELAEQDAKETVQSAATR